MSHVNKVFDSDPHFTINPITRQIVNDSSKKTTLIQYDNNSERFSFTMPKIVEGHDMTECNRVEVHYINTGTNKTDVSEDVYEVKDLQESPDDAEKIVFSWLLLNTATKFEGKLAFAIRFACINADGSVDYAWHTAIHSNITISKGMNNGEAVVEENSDVLAQWKEELFGASAEGVENIYTARDESLEEIDTAKNEAVTAIENAVSEVLGGDY